jgi:hypothetical protein
MKKLLLVSLVLILDLLSSHPAEAQKLATVHKIGFLGVSGGPAGAHEVFRRSLRELGHQEGHNIVIEYRSDEGRPRLVELATELIRQKVDVIVASGGPAARAANDVTKTIPIVFTTSGDPIESGFANSLARPGVNMTGMTWLSFELVANGSNCLSMPCLPYRGWPFCQIRSIQVSNGNYVRRRAPLGSWELALTTTGLESLLTLTPPTLQ